MLISTVYFTVSSVLIPTKTIELINQTHDTCIRLPWTITKLKAFAKTEMLIQYGWNRTEYKALNKLWEKESHWDSNAYNPVTSQGKHARGIPQILNLNPKLPAPQQIVRGLAYISKRYGKPSIAWSHERNYGWY